MFRQHSCMVFAVVYCDIVAGGGNIFVIVICWEQRAMVSRSVALVPLMILFQFLQHISTYIIDSILFFVT